MAKVGSSAVVSALERAALPVFHVHRMHAGHLAMMREQRAARGWRVPPLPAHDRLGLKLQRNVFGRGRPAKIVTLVRDPIGRNLSSYFEHLDDIWHAKDAHALIPDEEIAAGFMERYTHEEPLAWFDNEMLPVTGIDVYAYDFPEMGYRVIKTPGLDLLVLKCEIDDAAKRHVLAQFLGVDIPRLERANDTLVKSKGVAYRRFLDTIRLPRSYVEDMLESRYANHFYSRTERDRLRQRYGAPPVPSSGAARPDEMVAQRHSEGCPGPHDAQQGTGGTGQKH